MAGLAVGHETLLAAMYFHLDPGAERQGLQLSRIQLPDAEHIVGTDGNAIARAFTSVMIDYWRHSTCFWLAVCFQFDFVHEHHS